MAMIAIPVPENLRGPLRGIEVPGKKVPDPYHLTLVYLGQNVPLNQVVGALEATYEVVRSTRPFGIEIDRVSSFPSGPDGTPIICPVSNESLDRFRERLVDTLGDSDVPYDKTFPDFNGHVTLSYHDGKAPPDKTIKPLGWTVTEVILYGGDEGDERLTVRFPFSPNGAKQAYFRGLIRFAGSRG